MSKAFHIIVYSLLTIYVLFSIKLYDDYDKINDELQKTNDKMMDACMKKEPENLEDLDVNYNE